MMLAKQEGRPHIPRDGRHCDLCGCSQPAVRCDKCGCQIFCLSCDDMYHRHPKRRFHLRKAVDTTPVTPQARPVLPAKAGHGNPGDPSKMPLPPPRKKKPGKSFFDTFRRRSPSDDNSPPLPKKEYSWTDRFGNIKKFMSNRPLPPLPTSNGAEENMEPSQNLQSTKHDLSFIHKKVDEKPPQLPQRSLKPAEFTRGPHDKENLPSSLVGNGIRDMRNGTLNPSQMSRNNGFNEENQWNNRRNEHPNPSTLMRQPQSGYMYPGSPGYPGTLSNSMHQSASATDLQNLEGLPPQYPHYPMPPHFPYPPMYPHPQFPNYPPPHQYFGNSFANLSSQPATTDGDYSDHSEASSRHHPSSGKRYPFRKRAKRSQSVLVDKMAYPGQFYPFGPFPPGYGPGPWGAPYPMEGQAPPSPASSIRSLNRIGRTRRRKKTTSEDEEEDFSVSSSPLSRPKSSSSERPKMPAPETSSDEEEFEEAEKERSRSRSRSRNERQVPRKDSDPKRVTSSIARSPQVSQKKFSKYKKPEKHSDVEETRHSPAKLDRPPSKESNAGPSTQDTPPPIWIPQSRWECSHCTFINQAGHKICQVCCKTTTAEGVAVVDSRPPSSGSRKQSMSSEKSCSSPEKKMDEEEDVDTKKSKRDMAVLNSALDEAEKEISRGLEELMKLKEDFPPNKPESPQKIPPAKVQTSDSLPPPSKPIYKSSGKMRTSILDKLTLPSPTSKQPAAASTSTETQTGATSTTDRVIEARRGSTSSTTSDAYNSPIAQSPVDNKPLNKGPKKDTSCQTQTEELVDYLERRKAEEDAYFGRPNNGYGYRYGDRVTSPVFDRGGYPLMQRSHSRASLFTGRMNDLVPLDYGLGPSPMYRSVSRSSLTGDYPESSFADFQNLRKPAYYLSMEELVERRRQDSIRAQGLELVRMIREAEQQGFTADDIQVALHNCGNQSPMEWLQENWKQMVDQVVHLSASYANDKRENDVGVISEVEARDALRLHKGNIWPAVTECVESRQRKFLELKARGKFSSKDITDALSANQGDVEMTYAKLTKSSSKPFLMRIWGAGEGVQNQDIPPATKSNNNSMKDLEELYFRSKQADDVQSDETWDEEEWDEDYDEEDDEEEQGDLEDLQTCHDDVVKTPDSDRSDYCDAFGSNTLDRNMRLPSNETIDEVPETKLVRRGSFLSKLAGLKKNDKDVKQAMSGDLRVESPLSKEDTSPESGGSTDQSKSYNPISVIKNTISAIRDTVSGGPKGEKKLPSVALERRTIIVKGEIGHGMNFETDNVKLTSVKPLPEGEIISDNNAIVSQSTEMNGTDVKDKYSLSDTPETPVLGPKSSNNEIAGSEPKLSGAVGDACKSMSSEAAKGPSSNSEPSIINPLKEQYIPKLKETSSKLEVTSNRELNLQKPNEYLSRTSTDSSSQHIENDNFSMKSVIDSKQNNTLRSPENVRETVRASEELMGKEINTKSSPESITNNRDDFSFLDKLNKDSKDLHKQEENKGSDDNTFQDDKQQLGNKRTLKYIEPLSSSFSKKIAEKTNEVNSKNKTEKSQNMYSLATTSKSILSDNSTGIQKNSALENTNLENIIQTNDEKSFNIESKKSHDTKISKSIKPDSEKGKNYSLQTNTENLVSKHFAPSNGKTTDLIETLTKTNSDCDSSHLRPISANNESNALDDKNVTFKCSEITKDLTISKTFTTSDTIQNLQQSQETSKIKNEENEMHSTNGITSSINHKPENHCNETAENCISSMEDKQDKSYILDSSDIAKQNAITSEPQTKEIVEINNHMVTENRAGVVSAVDADIPLIDGIDNNAEVCSDREIDVSEGSPKYETMEPIHSSTFKRSPSLKKTMEDKMVAHSFPEGTSTEEIQSQPYSTNNKGNNVETKKLISSKDDSSTVAPIQTVEVIPSSSAVNYSASIETSSLNVDACLPHNDRISSPNKDNTSRVNNNSDFPVKDTTSARPENITSIHSETEQSHKDESSTLHLPTVAKDTLLESISPETHLSTLERASPISVASANTSTSEETKTLLELEIVLKENQKTQSIPNITHQINDKFSTQSGSKAKLHSETNINEENSKASRSSTPNTNSIPGTSQILYTSSKDAASFETISKELSATISKDLPSSENNTDSPSSEANSKDSAPSEIISKDSALSLTIPKGHSTFENITNDSTLSETSSKDSASLEIKSTDYASSTTVPAENIPSEPTTSTTDQKTLIRAPSADQEVSIEEDVSEEDNSVTPPSPVDALRHRFEGLIEDSSVVGPIRPASPFRRMSFRSRKEAIALERTRDTSAEKPWFLPKPKAIETKKPLPKRSLKQQMETDRKVRKLVSDKKVRTYRKAEIVVQLTDLNFEEEEAIQAANECSTFELALSYLQQECLLCTGHFPVSHIISMVHCQHKACRDCIRAYFTVQIRDRNIMELLCPFCNEPDISDEDIAQDYFNHLDMMLKKLVDTEIHELFQRKLRDRVLMRDPSFRWCSKCSSGFLAMENLKRLVCPDCNAVTCASCRRPWEMEHQGISCEAFAALKDGTDPDAQAVSLAKLLTEDGIDCPRCHFRYALAKGGCMHFRCIQCQHDFCSGCSRPFKMGQKCGVSEFCAKLGLHAHHPRNCLFYLRDKDPEDLQRLLDLSEVKYDRDPPEEIEAKGTCQVMEQKETSDGMVDDYCGKEVEKGYAGLCRVHYVEYLGQLVNKHKVDPIQIFENDDLELVLRRANIRLPPKRYRETDESYRQKLVNLIHEELPLDKMDGS